jgi:O-antigen/teichoic acid export membrane protein
VAWVSVFCTLFHLSIGPALQYRIQQNRAAYTAPAAFGTLLGLGVTVSFIAWLAAACTYLISDGAAFKGLSADILVLAFAALPLLLWEQYAPNLYASFSHMELVNRAQYVGRTAGVAAFLILVAWLQHGVRGALVAMLVTQSIIVATALIPLLRTIDWKLKWLGTEVKPLAGAGLKLHIGSISAVLLDQASILILNNFVTKAELGWFQLSLQLVGLILILPQSALLILYGNMAKSDPARHWPQQRRLILRVMGVVLLFAFAGWLGAPYLIPLVAGVQFTPSVSMFNALLPSLLGLSLSILLTPQWLGRGLFMLSNTVTFLALVVVVLGTVWTAPRYGIDGAIAVRVSVYAVILPIAHIAFWRWCSTQTRNITVPAMG